MKAGDLMHKALWLLRDASREFRQNDPLRMAAATSFFASFALPPIIIILIEVFGVFGNTRSFRQHLFEQLSVVTDKNIASQVRGVLHSVHALALGPGVRVALFIFLLFVASTLFEVIKNSLNQLWRIRLKDHPGILFMLLNRLKSIGIIIIAGILLSMMVLGDIKGWPLPAQVSLILYRGVALIAVIAWFALVFRYLSYGRPDWRAAIGGGAFTGLLFNIGEQVLHLVLSFKGMQTIYGASTSLVLLLLFVFYCSFIFYFGACFTLVLGEHIHRPIRPTPHAGRYTMKSVEWES